MQDESGNNSFLIVVGLYVLFVVIILSFFANFNSVGNLVAKEVLNIVESLNVE